LTAAAHALMETFEKLSAGFQREADARFRELLDFFYPSNGSICHSPEKGDNAL